MAKLSDTDLNILSTLYLEADITNKDLSAKLSLPTSTCQERVKKLKQTGVIEGYQCHVNLNDVGGYIEALAAIKLERHSEKIADNFRDDLLKMPEVIQVFHMGGDNDFIAHISVHDTKHLIKFVFSAFTSRDEVKNVETSIIFEHERSRVMPNFIQTS